MSPVLFLKNQSKQALATAALGFAATAVLFAAISHLEYSRVSYDFERRADNRIVAVQNGLQDAADDLAVVKRLFLTVGQVSREQFRDFAHPFLENHPHIQNFAFHRIISAVDRSTFEETRRAVNPRFVVTEVVDGKLIPARQKDRYRIVDYLEPMAGNEAAFGLDASSRRAQDEAALKACGTGLPSATAPYTLVQRNVTLRGLVMLAPVYRQGAVLSSAAARCDAVIGYVAAVFDAERLVERTLWERKLLNLEGYAVTVYAGNSPGSGSLVFRSEEARLPQAASSAILEKIFYRRPDDRSATFEVAGRQWLVVVSAVPLPILKNRLASLLMLLGGVLASILAAVYMQSLVVRSQRARQLSEERAEKLLREQNLRDVNRQLDEERTYLRTLFDQAPGFVAVLSGPRHVFEIANAAYYKLVGHRDILGKPVREALPDLDGQGFYELLDRVYESMESYVGESVPVTTLPDSDRPIETRYVDFVFQPMIGAGGNVTGIFVQGNDVSAERNAQQQVDHLANHDALTGLASGARIRSLLQQTIDRAESDGGSVLAMVIDLDRFKAANENFGPAAADGILKTIAERLKSICPGSAALARLGGDKFLFIVPEQAHDMAFSCTMQRIADAIGEKIVIEGHPLFLTCSIGIATYPADAVDPDALIQCADIAMYGAKALGSGNFRFYTAGQTERVQDRLKIETAIRSALDRNEFVLHYQPQVDLRTGHIVAVESLIRWNHPELGMVAPGTFIGIAEDAGLIVPIGEWALRTACAQLKNWHTAGFNELRVAVNLSARQFGHSNLCGLIGEALRANALPARYLDIELTESVVMDDVEHAIGILKELSTLGVQLSIDDFGTGYSSLAYLKRFPIDVLKIDRSFIREIPENLNDAAIADAIISMAHSLGMKVIAEGVETEAQCEFLSRNLCDEIQGFVFSEAVPALEMTALLQESQGLPAHLLREHKRRRTLLLVDDEASILSALKRQLRQGGYEILTATDGHQGLDLLAHNSVDVIVSDQRMPGMTGVEFLRKVKTLYPETVRIVLSGFTELQSVTDAVNEGAIYKFLTKPWDDDQLRAHIVEAFQHKEMADENRRLNIELGTANQELASANRQLEGLVTQKQQQILRREVSLDIVREALQHVPLPVIGLDEDDIVVFANHAADQLFEHIGLMLGSPVNEFIPEMSDLLAEDKEEMEVIATVNGISCSVAARRMGHGTQSRGTLITFTRNA